MKTLILTILFFATTACAEVNTSRAVIHHTSGPVRNAFKRNQDLSAKEIDVMHKKRGWDGIGYHFVIRRNGTIEEGRPLSKQGAHAKGRNNFVGIALSGYDEFTNLQISSLKKLLADLDVQHIERHHELCPGKGLNLNKIKEGLK